MAARTSSWTSRALRSRRAAGSAAVVAAAVALGLEGTPAVQGPPPVQRPVFRSGVQLVEVDVRVFDAQGRFVADLTRDEFELIESGVPQAIDAVHVFGVERTPSTPALDLASVSASPEPRQTWVFVFDLNHLSPGGGFDRARKAVEDFISHRLGDGDMAGVVAGDRMINNRFTSVKRELLEAVRQVKPRGGNRMRLLELTREWPRILDYEEAIRIARNEDAVVARAISRACADEPDMCGRADPEAMVRAKATRIQQEAHEAARQALSAMNGLASGLARMPGPKAVVFLSEGFVIQDIESTLRAVVGQTTRAGARVYAIDVRGLNRSANPGIIDQIVADDVFDTGLKFDAIADGPNSLAVDTGGLMIRNENNLGRALDRVAEDSGRYYVLAYQPVNSTLDGTFRPIDVRVKRHNVRVRARRGYLALAPARMLLPAPVATTSDRRAAPSAEAAAPPPGTPAEPATAGAAETARGVTVPAADAKAPGGVRLRPGAEDRVEALSSRESGSSSALAARGWEAYQRGDVETAHAAFLRAAAEPGVRPWVLYALGLSQAALGDPAGAVASWERVRQAAPDFLPVYLDLADGYAALSNLTSALATVRQAEARWPDSSDVHSAIGVILVRRGALDEGIRSLIRTTELDAEDDLAFLNLGRAYALRYQGSRRYVTSQRRWVAREDDRRMAVAALERCVKLAGPYAAQAREELTLLQWSVRQ